MLEEMALHLLAAVGPVSLVQVGQAALLAALLEPITALLAGAAGPQGQLAHLFKGAAAAAPEELLQQMLYLVGLPRLALEAEQEAEENQIREHIIQVAQVEHPVTLQVLQAEPLAEL